MVESDFVRTLAQRSLARALTPSDALRVLQDEELELMDLLQAAYSVRRQHFGKGVQVHIINNAQNGHCPEDCSYCSQAKTSEVDIEKYPPKEEQEVLAEAERAYRAGAHRYCMVYAGRGPSRQRTEKLASLVRKIKERFPIEVCVSAGLLDEQRAQTLKQAGLDRYNHNLNTSEQNYEKICTTHTYADRVRTVQSAAKAGLQVCSGLIVGMGESAADLVQMAEELGRLGASSIPVNFLLPFDGTAIDTTSELSPAYCLRVLCLFRFLNPEAEVRMAAGREVHLRSLEPLGLYPANSLFLEGYLNSRGRGPRQTLEMIRDAGFHVVSDFDLDALIAQAEAAEQGPLLPVHSLKSRKELRPTA